MTTRKLLLAIINEDHELANELMHGILVQKISEAVAQAVHGAKNHTGPGSDTQERANTAKTKAEPPKPRTMADLPAARKAATVDNPSAKKQNINLKDKTNADKVEDRLKRSNVKYRRVSTKDGNSFEFDDAPSKTRATRLARTIIDSTKEDEEWNG